MVRKSGKTSIHSVDSLFDLNACNVWSVDGYQVAAMWNKECSKTNFASKENKLLNIIRSAFEVVLYKKDNARAKQMYENGEWIILDRANNNESGIAIRQKQIKRLSDLNSENIKRITVATVLELIDRNFGGGWNSVPSNTQKVIESCFYIITIQLPSQRLHASGGILERKLKDGFDVLEIAKGTWTEAIFAKKKEVDDYSAEEIDDVDVVENKYSSSEDDIVYDVGDDVLVDDGVEASEDVVEEEYVDDDTLFNGFIDEDSIDEDEEDVSDGFIIEEE